MTEEENKTIREMIQNIEKNKKSIPSLSDLLHDSQYWMEIQKMNDEQKEEIKNLITKKERRILERKSDFSLLFFYFSLKHIQFYKKYHYANHQKWINYHRRKSIISRVSMISKSMRWIDSSREYQTSPTTKERNLYYFTTEQSTKNLSLSRNWLF